MLLVNDGEAKMLVLYSILNQRMCTDRYRNAAICEASQDLLALFSLHASCKPHNRNPHRFQQGFDTCKVLLREDFSWRHNAGLEAVIHSEQRDHHGHDCFAAA